MSLILGYTGLLMSWELLVNLWLCETGTHHTQPQQSLLSPRALPNPPLHLRAGPPPKPSQPSHYADSAVLTVSQGCLVFLADLYLNTLQTTSFRFPRQISDVSTPPCFLPSLMLLPSLQNAPRPEKKSYHGGWFLSGN